MRKSVFIREELNKEISQNGYIVFDHRNDEIPLILQELYSKYSEESPNSGFNTTHFSHNRQYKEEVLLVAKMIFELGFEHLFENYEVFFANFMVKTPGDNHLLPVHADWAYIDEDNESIISLWIPAVNISKDNGALGVIPKSHLLYEKVRGPEIVSSFRKFDKDLMEQRGVLKLITNLQAVIYDLRLLHYSLPNFSDKVRIAINITLKPKDVELIHYSQQGDKIYKYDHLDEKFYLNYNAHQIPENLKPCEILPIIQQISDEEVIKFHCLEIGENTPHLSFWEKISSIFKGK